MPLHVRPVAPAEIDLFAEMVVALYQDDPGPVPMGAARARLQAAQMLARPNDVWPLLLVQAGDIVGYAVLVPYFSNEFGGDVVCLDELFVRREHRGSGIGGELLETLRRWAAAARVPRFELFVNQSNARVVRFYERHGFHVAKRILLACQLSDPAPGGEARARPSPPRSGP